PPQDIIRSRRHAESCRGRYGAARGGGGPRIALTRLPYSVSYPAGGWRIIPWLDSRSTARAARSRAGIFILPPAVAISSRVVYFVARFPREPPPDLAFGR